MSNKAIISFTTLKEIPKSCRECTLSDILALNSNLWCYPLQEYVGYPKQRDERCPLKEIEV